MASDLFWVMRQTWCDLLFAHWEVPVKALRRVVPDPLEIDLFEGRAYIAVVPFGMTGIRGRWLPPLPGISRSLELNVRTYVRFGGASGVYFFSLDAESPGLVYGARATYRLPYFRAKMSWDGRRYVSERAEAPAAELRVEYGSQGAVTAAAAGSLEWFLTERYALFTVSRGAVITAGIRHPQWPLEPTWARFEVNTMTKPLGIELDGEPLLHFAKRLDVVIGAPRTVR